MATSIADVLAHVQRWTSPRLADFSDAVLLERFVHGREEAAFAELVARHGAMVLRSCRRVLGDVQASEDAFQATFLVLARKAHTLRQAGALPGFLHSVARRLALKTRTQTVRASQTGLPDTLSDPRGDPLARLTARELLMVLDEEVQHLPSAQRSAVVLCCLEGHAQEEAARLLGWTVGSLKGHLQRGRRRLHVRLTRRGIALPAALAVVAVSRGAAASALLQQCAVRAALGGAIGSPATALAESVLNGMATSKFASITALVMTVALSASTVALVYRSPASEPPKSKTTATPIAAKVTGAGKPETRTDAQGDPLPDGAIARLGTVRFRHGLPVTFLSFTPDGKRLLSQGGDGVRVWDGASGEQLRYFAFDAETFGDLSPDGKQVAATSRDHKSVQLWDIDNGRLIGALDAKHSLRVRFSPDGKLLAVAANYPGGIELWDVATRKQLRAWQARPPQFVEHLDFSADSRRLLTAEGDKRMRLWDVATGRQLQEFAFDRERGVLSPDAKWVAVLEANEKTEPSPGAAEWIARIRLWDATTGKPARSLTCATRVDTPFRSVTFTADSKRLVTSGPDQFLRVWDPATGKELRRLPFEAGLPHVLALSRDGRTLAATVDGGGAIRLVDMTSGKERTPQVGHQGYVKAAALSPDGRTAVTNSMEGDLLVWDAITGRRRRSLDGEQTAIQSLRFAPDGRTLLSGAGDAGSLYAWDLLTGTGRRRIAAEPRTNRTERTIVSPDGKSVVCQDFDQTIRLFDAASGKQQRRFSIQVPAQLLGLALTPGARSLVVWSNDRKVRLWDATDGRQMHVYSLPLNKESIPPGETRVVSYYHAALSPDGRLLALGSQHNHAWATDDQGKIVQGAKPEHYLILLDLTTGCIAGRFDKVTSDASSLAFSPDSRLLAWGGYGDPALHVVEVASGRERRRFLGHRGFVTALTFSVDGKTLLSGSMDTTSLIWDLARRPEPQATPPTMELAALWADLAGDDAAHAYQAIRRLAADPNAAVPFLGKRLRPVPAVDEKRLARLLADLESDDLATRRKATAELTKRADQPLAMYRKTLQGKPSLETRRRLEELLEKASGAWWDVSGERLRSLRAIEALELAGTKEARELLESLAGGASGARLTEQAKAALERLANASTK